MKSKCCKKFEKKAALCKGCPLRLELQKKARRKILKKAKKRLAKAA